MDPVRPMTQYGLHLDNGTPQATHKYSTNARNGRNPARHDTGIPLESQACLENEDPPQSKLVNNEATALYDLNKSAFLQYSLGGPVQISHQSKTQLIVALRTLRLNRLDDRILEIIRKFRDNHVVCVNTAIFRDGYLSIVRDYKFDITLRVMCGVLRPPLAESEIAVIVHHVVRGLSYIHDKLKLIHGQLNCETVLVSLFGAIRICKVVSILLTDLTYSRQH